MFGKINKSKKSNDNNSKNFILHKTFDFIFLNKNEVTNAQNRFISHYFE